MNINGNLNNGNQIFQENNYFPPRERKQSLDEIIEKPKRVGNIKLVFLVEFISIVADILTIISLFNQIEKDGLLNAVISYSIHLPLFTAGIITVFTILLGKAIFELITRKEFGAFIRKGSSIYKIPLKKCPICGDSAGGDIQIRNIHGKKYYTCNRDTDHKWKFEYHQIYKLI